MNKPTRDWDTQTLPFNRIRENIIEETSNKLELKITERLKATNDIKVKRLEDEISDLNK